TRLSDFLRLTLDSAAVQEVTLKREMEYLDKYLEIEQVRFGDRLEVRRAIEPGALDLLVPNLVLQPVVENAVRHGIAPRASGGRIDVVANESEGKAGHRGVRQRRRRGGNSRRCRDLEYARAPSATVRQHGTARAWQRAGRRIPRPAGHSRAH